MTYQYRLLSSFLCKCAAFPKNAEEEQELLDVTKQYREEVNSVVLTGRYDTKDDFTVVVQPFFSQTAAPIKVRENE